jgi:hypothetical protein
MSSKKITVSAVAAVAVATLVVAQQNAKKKEWRTSPTGYSDTPVIPGQNWKVHDIERPKPAVVTPGTPSTQAKIGTPPSDAIVLFDGKDLSKWREVGKGYDGEARWKIKDGAFEAATGLGTLMTKEKFGDIQLHVEWAAPAVIDGDSQWRGNSGILLMNRYEVQVLDSYNNPTYADGQAGAIYGWWPPMVNASRKPGEWQTYDIVFEAPRFSGNKLEKPAYVTVFHNGVLLHHKQEIGGPMAHRVVRQYEAHAPEEPLGLQNHDTLTRYRYIWVRKLKGYDGKS